MVQLKIRTTTNSSQVITDVDSTPMKVFSENSIPVDGKSVQLNGMTLSVTDMNSTFAQLGVADGSTAILGCVQKADSAR
jgi:hypothetical protein